MKKLFIKSTNRILAGLMGLCGFSGTFVISCFACPEYAAPPAVFTIKGAVVNEATGKPVAGIRVGYSPAEWNENAFGPKPEYYWGPETFVISNTNGGFTLTGKSNGFRDNIAPVYIEDIDGGENGLFLTKKVNVDFKNAAEKTKRISSCEYETEYTITTTIQLAEVALAKLN